MVVFQRGYRICKTFLLFWWCCFENWKFISFKNFASILFILTLCKHIIVKLLIQQWTVSLKIWMPLYLLSKLILHKNDCRMKKQFQISILILSISSISLDHKSWPPKIPLDSKICLLDTSYSIKLLSFGMLMNKFWKKLNWSLLLAKEVGIKIILLNLLFNLVNIYCVHSYHTGGVTKWLSQYSNDSSSRVESMLYWILLMSLSVVVGLEQGWICFYPSLSFEYSTYKILYPNMRSNYR